MQAVLSKLKLPELKNIIRYYNREVKIPLSLRKPELIAALVKHLSKPIELNIELAKKPLVKQQPPKAKTKRAKSKKQPKVSAPASPLASPPASPPMSASTNLNLSNLSAQNKMLLDIIAERRKANENATVERQKRQKIDKRAREEEDARLRARLRELEELM